MYRPLPYQHWNSSTVPRRAVHASHDHACQAINNQKLLVKQVYSNTYKQLLIVYESLSVTRKELGRHNDHDQNKTDETRSLINKQMSTQSLPLGKRFAPRETGTTVGHRGRYRWPWLGTFRIHRYVYWARSCAPPHKYM